MCWFIWDSITLLTFLDEEHVRLHQYFPCSFGKDQLPIEVIFLTSEWGKPNLVVFPKHRGLEGKGSWVWMVPRISSLWCKESSITTSSGPSFHHSKNRYNQLIYDSFRLWWKWSDHPSHQPLNPLLKYFLSGTSVCGSTKHILI